MDRLLSHPFSPLQEIQAPELEETGVRLFVKRDDELYLSAYEGDRAFGGNKWRKLKYNLLAAREAGQQTLLTFGGAYSNHIAATASAGAIFGFRTVGVIRGDAEFRNPTLRHAERCGMILHFLDRSAYREKGSPEMVKTLKLEYDDPYLIPEGGTNLLALRGCRELAAEVLSQVAPENTPDWYGAACGTGGTFAGLISGFGNTARGLGFPVLKGGFHQKAVEKLLGNQPSATGANWAIQGDYHFGGYARFTPGLIDFINQFKEQFGISLDPVYTGKVFYGVLDLIKKGTFPEGSAILIIHTGGLQGVAGFNERFGSLIF